MVKNPARQFKRREMRGRSLGGEDPLEEEMAAHGSILAWKIPWTEGAWWVAVRGVERVGRD